ncbi:peroxisome biogenesis protein 22-like [Carex rostrata]
MSDHAGTLVSRVARHLNRKLSDLITLLLNHKSAGSIGAVAGFAIAVVFAWKVFRPSQPRPRPKRTTNPASNGRSGGGHVAGSDESDLGVVRSPRQLAQGDNMRRKLGGCRKVTCQLLSVILEEKSSEELQKHITVRESAVKVLSELAKHCDLYLMETVLDDETEERVLSALEAAGIFRPGSLMKEKVLFCSTEIGRTSFVRQLESDLHIDTNLDVISQLSRFIGRQLYISEMEEGQIGPNIFTSASLEHFFS